MAPHIPADTSTEADQVQHSLWAKLSVAERSGKALEWSQDLLQLSRYNIDLKFPHADEDELTVLYVSAQYGEELALAVRAQLKSRHARR